MKSEESALSTVQALEVELRSFGLEGNAITHLASQ